MVLSGLILFLVFRNIDWASFWSKAQSTDLSWVILSIFLSLAAYWARAYRWNILLEPLGYPLKTRRTMLAVLVGYLVNLAIPRLGEIARCTVLKRNDGVTMPHAIGSVISERIIDFFTLIILFLVSLWVEYDRLSSFLRDAYQSLPLPNTVIYGGVFLFISGGLAFFFWIRRSGKLQSKISSVLAGFLEGILSLRKIKRPVGFFVSTLVLWAVYYFMSYLIVFSLPETSGLGPGAGFMLLVTGGIAVTLPVQSGFGTYHGMIAAMLLLYGIDKTTGLFLATLLHTSQVVAVAFFGTIAFIISAILRKKQNLTA